MPYELLTKTINSVITIHDPYGIYFDFFEIKTKTDINIKHIEKMYKKLALIYHPDKNSQDIKNAEINFKRLTYCKDILIDFVNKQEHIPSRSRREAHNSSTIYENKFAYAVFVTKLDFSSVLNKTTKNKINEIISMYNGSNYFHVIPRRYLFDILQRLYTIDTKGTIHSLSKQCEMGAIISSYNSSNYFHVGPRRDIFNGIKMYF